MIINSQVKILWLAILVIGLFPVIGFSQSKGDRVVVSATVYTKIQQKKVGQVFMGDIDTITDINGKWCALSRSKGWLPLQYVMNLDTAEKHFSNRIKKNKGDFDAWAIRGMIRKERNQLDAALKDLNESIRLNQNKPMTFNNRAVVLIARNEFPEALANLNQAIKIKADFANAHENRGLVMRSMGQYEEAIKNYNKAISLSQNSPNPWSYINRGDAKSNLGDYKGAKNDFLQALRIDRRISDAYVGLSIVYLAENDYDRAFKYAAEAIKRNKKNGLAYNQRGWTNFKLGKYEDAIVDFDLAIRFAPTLSLVFNNRGICYTELQKYDLAIKDFNRAVALNSKSAVAFSNRGAAFMGKKNYKKAQSDFENAIKLSPKLADAANVFGWFLATCPNENFRNGEKAIEHAKKACELSNWKEWSYLDTLAAAHAEKGDFAKAVELETKAIAMAPEEGKSECEERLALYKQQKPYRSEFGKASSEKNG